MKLNKYLTSAGQRRDFPQIFSFVFGSRPHGISSSWRHNILVEKTMHFELFIGVSTFYDIVILFQQALLLPRVFSAHLAYFVHKSGRKTSIIIIIINIIHGFSNCHYSICLTSWNSCLYIRNNLVAILVCRFLVCNLSLQS